MKMENTLKEAIELLKRMTEKDVEKALESLRNIKAESDKEKKMEVPKCVYCGEDGVVRNGQRHNKQAYICRKCGKTFVETTKTAFYNSHSGEAVWKQVIKDTVNGIPIDETAENLELHHDTVFNMRHKILFCLEQEERRNPIALEGVCEADETYVLESYKGKKLPPDFWRKARKHGAVAVKPGLSNEYICICTSTSRDGGTVAKAVNRATAGKTDISNVLGTHVSSKTVVLSDGAKSYGVLEETGECAVINTNDKEESFFNLNTVNGFHSFIKERNRNARGFGTKFLNRYNALFSKIFGATKVVVDDIFNLLCDAQNRNCTINESQTQELLQI
jgi:transposase-like protein